MSGAGGEGLKRLFHSLGRAYKIRFVQKTDGEKEEKKAIREKKA